jgi:hypothetical protein
MPTVYDVGFDGHKYTQATATVLTTGSTSALNIRFIDINRVQIIIAFTAKVTPGGNAFTIENPQIGTTTSDYNIVGITIQAAAGLTIAVTGTVLGI